MSSKIPPKFYQICRICLALISDSELSKRSIFNNNVNKSTITATTTTGGSRLKQEPSDSVSNNFFDMAATVDDELDYMDISARIAECLNIKVSIHVFTSSLFCFTSPIWMKFENIIRALRLTRRLFKTHE